MPPANEFQIEIKFETLVTPVIYDFNLLKVIIKCMKTKHKEDIK